MQQLTIIGRETNLAYAELESVFGDIERFGQSAVLLKNPNSYPFSQLGSVIKMGDIFEKSTLSQAQIISKITDRIAAHFATTSVNSVDFGISVYSSSMNAATYKHLLIQVKKGLRQRKIKCRFVVPKQLDLNAAQIKHNKLIGTGIEILLVSNGTETALAQTNQVQDVDDYTKRDFGRPNRNMKVGMFPPKLAQIMLSLATPTATTTVYDPFCGSGVVLQEAVLRGNPTWGSDISEEMVRDTTQNINWVKDQYDLAADFSVFVADATLLTNTPEEPFVVVTEGFLGTMMSYTPSIEEVEVLRGELGKLYLDFLTNLAGLKLHPNSIVITLPCWQTSAGLKKLNIIDQIKNLGYTVKQFKSTSDEDLIYKRDTQIVGRQIVVLLPRTK